MSDYFSIREDLKRRLSERGVGSAELIVDHEVSDDELAGAQATVNWYDDQPQGKITAALLLWALRNRTQYGYLRPHEREERGATAEITPALIRSIKAVCSSPNGITREEARGLYAEAASRRGVRVDVLLDAAMGRDWQGTPPHPAFDPENPNKARDYERLVAGV